MGEGVRSAGRNSVATLRNNLHLNCGTKVSHPTHLKLQVGYLNMCVLGMSLDRYTAEESCTVGIPATIEGSIQIVFQKLGHCGTRKELDLIPD